METTADKNSPSESRHSEELQKFDTLQYNVFKHCDEVGREEAFVTTSMSCLRTSLEGLGADKVNPREVAAFLRQIWQGYFDYNVTYHSDIHGLDVCQMTSLIMQGPNGMAKTFNFTHLDVFSVLIAAVSHDYKHDGFNNLWHINTGSDRFQNYGKDGTQEQFHVAQTYAVVKKTNLLKNFDQKEEDHFRKRLIGCILATDMARHAQDLKEFQSIIEASGIKDGQPVDNIISPDDVFASQQKLAEIAVHSSDISFFSRGNDIAEKWVELLFLEFFYQGDLERENNVAISMLCDRTTVNCQNTQPFFIKNFTLPLFNCISTVLPDLAFIQEAIEKNCEAWEKMPPSEKLLAVNTNKEIAILDPQQKLWHEE